MNVMFISGIVTGGAMATAKTGSFYLNETITLPAANPTANKITGTIDLSAYINVPTGQAIAIDQVDFIFQNTSEFAAGPYSSMISADGAFTVQVTDLNPGNAFVRGDDQSLIASGGLNIDFSNNTGTMTTDIYPDNFGPSGLSDMFLVVNDQLYVTAGNDNVVTGGNAVYVTARIRCRVVKLSTKDWMAIAIQSTAADN